MRTIITTITLLLISTASFAGEYTYEKVGNTLKMSKTTAEVKTLNVLKAEKAQLTSQIATNLVEIEENIEKINIKLDKQNAKIIAKNVSLQTNLDQKNTEITEAIKLGIVEDTEI